VWPQKDVPLRPVGKLTLNRNVSFPQKFPFRASANSSSKPENYFAEIEQAAFSPGHLIPGVEASADPVLQARLFSYPDSQRHRLGTNYQQIPVNQPLHPYNPFQRDGYMAVNGNLGSHPNYPSSFEPLTKPEVYAPTNEQWGGKATNFQFGVTEEDFVQATALWSVLGRTEGQQGNFVGNVASHLKDAEKGVRERTYGMFGRVDEGLGKRIEEATEKIVNA